MSVATKSAVGVGIGTVMAGVTWYILRSQDRAQLVQLLTNDAKIPVLRATAPFMPVPKNLQLVADGKFEDFADEQILFFDTKSPKKVYEEVCKGVSAYLASIPEDALEKVFKSLGIDMGMLNQLKDILKLIGVAGGSGGTTEQKKRPGT